MIGLLFLFFLCVCVVHVRMLCVLVLIFSAGYRGDEADDTTE